MRGWELGGEGGDIYMSLQDKLTFEREFNQLMWLKMGLPKAAVETVRNSYIRRLRVVSRKLHCKDATNSSLGESLWSRSVQVSSKKVYLEKRMFALNSNEG